ncbi:class I SAM-dependent RNA methyltransferase [Demetria terragena]|uniref:class I SAM-dependent RNA methyltransferase n=1 Tax=Demetria terragena TaxID=63959 RepID=UPI0003743D75|nr:TRAM domain-containing protein [Demetria terragena]
MNAPRRGRRGVQRGQQRKPKGRSLVGQRLELDIGDVAHGGHCVARHEGRVVFVRHTLPGELVIAQVTSGTDTSPFLRADAIDVVRPAPQRRSAPCPVSGPGGCGGCDWQHTDAAYGRDLKARVIKEQLKRLAHLEVDVEVEPVPGDRDGLRWRTRLELAVERNGRAGLRGHRSHDVIPVDDCLIATEPVTKSGVLQDVFDPHIGRVEVVEVSGGDVVTIERGQAAPTVHEQVRFEDHELSFAVEADGFWQVHPGAARTLVDAVREGVKPKAGERVVDLYAGVGLFASEMAREVGPEGSVVAVEGDVAASAHARTNLRATPWAGPVHADVTDWALTAPELQDADVVILDPPRTGAGREVTAAVLAGRPRAVGYVACDPAALARDLATATEAGYDLVSLRAYDIFPMTHHVECVAILVPRTP